MEDADPLGMLDNSCRVFVSVVRDVACTLEFFRLEGNVAIKDVGTT
jgi:hypothetical protein